MMQPIDRRLEAQERGAGGMTDKRVALSLKPDELRALDDALSFVEGARHEEENTADFRTAVGKVRRAAEKNTLGEGK